MLACTCVLDTVCLMYGCLACLCIQHRMTFTRQRTLGKQCETKAIFSLIVLVSHARVVLFVLMCCCAYVHVMCVVCATARASAATSSISR
jgi:hypothetical protein